MEAVDLISDIGGPLAVLGAGYAVLKARFNAHEKRTKEKEAEMDTRLEKISTSRRSGDEKILGIMEKTEDTLHRRIDKTQESLKETETKLERKIDKGFEQIHQELKDLTKIILEK